MSKEKILLSVDIFVDLFNALPMEEESLRAVILHYIKNYKADVNRKGHIAEGFYLDENGKLVFDEKLYDEAIYRGKIDTYTKATKSSYNRLIGDLEMLQAMDEEHVKKSHIADKEKMHCKLCEGNTVSEESLKLLRNIKRFILLPDKDELPEE